MIFAQFLIEIRETIVFYRKIILKFKMKKQKLNNCVHICGAEKSPIDFFLKTK